MLQGFGVAQNHEGWTAGHRVYQHSQHCRGQPGWHALQQQQQQQQLASLLLLLLLVYVDLRPLEPHDQQQQQQQWAPLLPG
jgi:hypothetical protein